MYINNAQDYNYKFGNHQLATQYMTCQTKIVLPLTYIANIFL